MSANTAPSLLRQSPSDALALSQHAAHGVEKKGSSSTLFAIPFISSAESADSWAMCETELYSCLRTGDDKAAHICLERLVKRFGADNERVMGLRGLYQEAVAGNNAALEHVLLEYEQVLADDPINTPIAKRRIALLRSLSRIVDATNALVELLEISPIDIEAWSELSDLYVSQGLYQQAEYCLEEILLTAPFAWNVHARLGELLYISAFVSHNQMSVLAESVRRFCRSIELCDGYIRGYYGLKLVSDRLLHLLEARDKPETLLSPSSGGEELVIMQAQSLQALNEKATSALAEYARNVGQHERTNPEDLAVRELLKHNTIPQHR